MSLKIPYCGKGAKKRAAEGELLQPFERHKKKRTTMRESLPEEATLTAWYFVQLLEFLQLVLGTVLLITRYKYQY